MELNDGRLLLLQENQLREQYLATSGLPSWQTWEDQRQKGKGPLPRPDLVGNVDYQVETTPIALPSTPGVQGNFYKILPFEVTFRDGLTRGDFGIHFDAGVPGSAGCIVLRTASGWEGFEKQMKKLADAGIPKIPLMPSYSF